MKQRQETIEALFRHVMDDLGHEGWMLNWDNAGCFCWISKKQIDISLMDSSDKYSPDECEQMLLHEIAHIDTAELVGTQHTSRFWRYTEELVRKYLDSDLSEWQKGMRAVHLGLAT